MMPVVSVAAVIHQRKLKMVQQMQGGWIDMVHPMTDIVHARERIIY
jgi:hypothetical protein